MALSDSELILVAQKGNHSAFEELVYRYDKKVLSLALKYTANEDDAKDIYQEVFIRMYKGLKNFRFRSEFSTWLFRITTNVCLTFKSRSKSRTSISLSPGNEDDDHDILQIEGEKELEPDKLSMDRELRRKIETAVDMLTPKQKMCFTLKHFEGFKIREIAVMMDCNEGTVKKYLFDGIRKMRVYLKEYSINGV